MRVRLKKLLFSFSVRMACLRFAFHICRWNEMSSPLIFLLLEIERKKKRKMGERQREKCVQLETSIWCTWFLHHNIYELKDPDICIWYQRRSIRTIELTISVSRRRDSKYEHVCKRFSFFSIPFLLTGQKWRGRESINLSAFAECWC